MENKKAIIGGILGIGLLIGLVWFLFFRKGKSGKSVVANVLPRKNEKPQPQNQRPQKQVIYVGGGGASASSAFPLRQGSVGRDVKILQEALNKAGFDAGTADGVWGNNTQKAFSAAFPNKLGIKDLADLEKTIAELEKIAKNKNSTPATPAKSDNTTVKFDPRYQGVRHVVLRRTPVTKTAGDSNAVAIYYVGDKIILTGRWQRVNGVTWSEFERHNNNGLAWIRDSNIKRA